MEDNDVLPKNISVIEQTNQVIELQTIIHDRNTCHSDFVFYANRLMRLVIEEGLNRLPYTDVTVRTPDGYSYTGIAFKKGNCGVSVCRSGEAMEQALRQCCRSIRIGKMLLDDDQRLLYARLIPDVRERRVLLLYPLISTGNIVMKAISVLVENGVKEENILILTLFTTPLSLKEIVHCFPKVAILTSSNSPLIPYHFATKYFGTD
uniref:Uracil phosphoribosyltransferase homolog n=1 Tax=Syphacia muris TaxID=451379 RepID=A0A0N5B1C5_9BILA